MAQGIRIPFISDVTNFLRGTKDVEAKLEDVEDALDDVAKEGDQATEKLERSFKDLADSADNSFKGIRQSSKRAMDDAADDVKGSRFKDTGTEIGAEFSENIGEGLRSGDYLGTLEETGTSLAAALGPLGIGLGIGTAFVANILRGMDAQKKAITEKAGEIFSTLVESGKLQLTELEIQQQAAALLFSDGFANLKKAAEAAGIPVAELARAMSGDTEAMDNVRDALARVETQVDDSSVAMLHGAATIGSGQADVDAMKRKIEELNTALDINEKGALEAEKAMIRYQAANLAAATSIEAVSNAYKRGDYVAAVSAQATSEQAFMRANPRERSRP